MHYLFIHGAWHARWCWQYTTPLLKELGHEVFDPDLPGHGENKIDFTHITLATYVEAITQLIISIDKPVVLVGHSMAGVIISQIAENIPEHIKQLIYINGFIPENNGSLLQEAQRSDSPGISTQLAMNPKKNEIIIKKTVATKKLLFNCCNHQDAELGMSLLANEPLQPFFDTIKISPGKFGSVKKLYIACLQDHVLPMKDQKRMAKKSNCNMISIDTDHSPFFSAADKLVKIIIN